MASFSILLSNYYNYLLCSVYFIYLSSLISTQDLKILYSIIFQENPNCLLIVTPKGGHLGWVAGDQAPIGAPWTDPVVMDFLEHLERGKSKPVSSSSNIQGSELSAEVVRHLEV